MELYHCSSSHLHINITIAIWVISLCSLESLLSIFELWTFCHTMRLTTATWHYLLFCSHQFIIMGDNTVLSKFVSYNTHSIHALRLLYQWRRKMTRFWYQYCQKSSSHEWLYCNGRVKHNDRNTCYMSKSITYQYATYKNNFTTEDPFNKIIN